MLGSNYSVLRYLFVVLQVDHIVRYRLHHVWVVSGVPDLGGSEFAQRHGGEQCVKHRLLLLAHHHRYCPLAFDHASYSQRLRVRLSKISGQRVKKN